MSINNILYKECNKTMSERQLSLISNKSMITRRGCHSVQAGIAGGPAETSPRGSRGRSPGRDTLYSWKYSISSPGT